MAPSFFLIKDVLPFDVLLFFVLLTIVLNVWLDNEAKKLNHLF